MARVFAGFPAVSLSIVRHSTTFDGTRRSLRVATGRQHGARPLALVGASRRPPASKRSRASRQTEHGKHARGLAPSSPLGAPRARSVRAPPSPLEGSLRWYSRAGSVLIRARGPRLPGALIQCPRYHRAHREEHELRAERCEPNRGAPRVHRKRRNRYRFNDQCQHPRSALAVVTPRDRAIRSSAC